MKTRTLQQTTIRYVQGCTKTFLEREQTLGWIQACLLRSGLTAEQTGQAVAPLVGYGDVSRFRSLVDWLRRRTESSETTGTTTHGQSNGD